MPATKGEHSRTWRERPTHQTHFHLLAKRSWGWWLAPCALGVVVGKWNRLGKAPA